MLANVTLQIMKEVTIHGQEMTKNFNLNIMNSYRGDMQVLLKIVVLT